MENQASLQTFKKFCSSEVLSISVKTDGQDAFEQRISRCLADAEAIKAEFKADPYSMDQKQLNIFCRDVSGIKKIQETVLKLKFKTPSDVMFAYVGTDSKWCSDVKSLQQESVIGVQAVMFSVMIILMTILAIFKVIKTGTHSEYLPESFESKRGFFSEAFKIVTMAKIIDVVKPNAEAVKSVVKSAADDYKEIKRINSEDKSGKD